MEDAKIRYRPIDIGTSYLEDRGSKFFGLMCPLESDADISQHVEQLKQSQKGIGHVAYGAVWDQKGHLYRSSDDGEPGGTAGKPILNHITGKRLAKVLVAVARIYGGTPLGKGGLIRAYGQTALLAIEHGTVEAIVLTQTETLEVDHARYAQIRHQIEQRAWMYQVQYHNQGASFRLEIPEADLENYKTWKSEIHGT